MTDRMQCFIGYDPRPMEVQCFAVARASMRRHINLPIKINGLVLSELKRVGLYTRPMERRDGVLYDIISDKPMSTEFALSRFLVPFIAESGWALFTDADVLARKSVWHLFRKCQADKSKAVYVVKHNYTPASNIKMDGQPQLSYPRKNWSSVVVWNVEHPANQRLTLHMVNTAPGLWLHQFGWLEDAEIGELDVSWNWLSGISDPAIDPAIVHFTNGSPEMEGYENSPYADEWRRALEAWAA